jgi:hypothetical protein
MDAKLSNQEWETPIPVDKPELPKFPVSALPPVLRDWVLAESHFTQTPPELASLLALAMCAGCVARRIEIDCGWREPINLWCTVLLPPGNRKSAVFEAAKRPLKAIEKELIEVAQPELSRARAEKAILEKALAKQVSAATGVDDEAAQVASEIQQKLDDLRIIGPRIFGNDVTDETLGKLLADQDGRLIVASAEGGIFGVMGGRYSKSGANFDNFLSAHAGEEIIVDRMSRDAVVDRACVTMALTIQPDVLASLREKKTFQGRGLLGRFLWAVPLSPLGGRIVRGVQQVPEEVEQGYEMLIRRLFGLGESIGLNNPRTLELHPDATEKFLDWQEEVERMLGADGQLESFTDWGGKLSGLTARLAAVIHLIGAGVDLSKPVTLESIESAIAISKWAIPHARAAFGLLRADDGAMEDAERVLKWLKKKELSQTSKNDIRQQFRSKFDNEPDRLMRAIELLVDRGWLRPVDSKPVTPGRPSEPYECHPWIAKPVQTEGVL